MEMSTQKLDGQKASSLYVLDLISIMDLGAEKRLDTRFLKKNFRGGKANGHRRNEVNKIIKRHPMHDRQMIPIKITLGSIHLTLNR